MTGLVLITLVFRKYGKVDDVCIPSKKNKQGNRFGFVRINNVLDAKFMESNLATTLIGNQKLQVNIPLFARDSQKWTNGDNGRPTQL